jgi:hypothetical protein
VDRHLEVRDGRLAPDEVAIVLRVEDRLLRVGFGKTLDGVD